MPEFRGFVGGAYQARSRTFDAQQCINLYPEVSESGPGPSKSVAALIGTPGRRLWTTLVGGPVRGLRRFNATTAVAVCGNNVYALSTTGAATLLATVPDDGKPVSMDYNGSVMGIACSLGSYAVDPTTPGSIVNLGVGATNIGFIDGRLLLNKVDTGQLVYTGLYNSTVSPLNFVTAEGSPDNLLAFVKVHREAWLFGEESTEVFFPTGDTSVPFARVGNAFIQMGIAAPRSAVRLGNTVYWLAAGEEGQGTVQRANGFEPERVSTHAIEYAINSYSRIDDAVAYSYLQEGHNFYVLTFPTAGVTWVYDAATNLWHQRAYRDPSTGVLEQVREQCQMAFAGMVLVGDRTNGNIYVLDLDTYTDNGDPILRRRRAPHVTRDQEPLTHNRLEVLIETGVGLSVPAGTAGQDPQAALSWSDDGGRTFGNEHMAPMGKIGEYKRRVSWRRLGTAVDRVYQMDITDPVKVVITGANLK